MGRPIIEIQDEKPQAAAKREACVFVLCSFKCQRRVLLACWTSFSILSASYNIVE